MYGQLLDLMAVNGSLLLLYGIPPALAIRAWWRGSGQPESWLLSLVAGVSVQSVIGMLWDHLIGADAGHETVCYFVFWLGVSLIAVTRKADRSEARPPMIRRELWCLAAILLLALTVRCLHPLRHAALGQSDAYAHLVFVKDVLTYGRLRHPGYPPGYHWVMAMPTLVFNLDPYIICRYGGAFWGLLLVLSSYVLVRRSNSPFAALMSAFLIACFPGLMLLIKTSVGAFANQMGLALIPVILHLYGRFLDAASRHDRQRWGTLLSGTLLALAGAVPLILLNVILLLGLERLLAILTSPRRRAVVGTLLPLMVIMVPAGLLLALHFVHAGASQAQVAAAAVTGVRPHPPAASGPVVLPGFLQPLRDFLSVKRLGFGSTPMNLAGVVLLLAFIRVLAQGVTRDAVWLRTLGLLGVLSGVQTLTGFLEFTMYQRAGWNLLAATGWLGGMAAYDVCLLLRPRGVRHAAVVCGVASSVAGAILFPPAHRPTISTAEDELVSVTRQLAFREAGRLHAPLALSFEKSSAFKLPTPFHPDLPIVLVVRSTSGATGSWEIPRAVTALGSPLEMIYVGRKTDLNTEIHRNLQYAFFLDRTEKISARDLGAVAHLSPLLVDSFSKSRLRLYGINTTIRNFLAHLPPRQWTIHPERLSGNADLVIVTPMSEGP